MGRRRTWAAEQYIAESSFSINKYEYCLSSIFKAGDEIHWLSSKHLGPNVSTVVIASCFNLAHLGQKSLIFECSFVDFFLLQLTQAVSTMNRFSIWQHKRTMLNITPNATRIIKSKINPQSHWFSVTA